MTTGLVGSAIAVSILVGVALVIGAGLRRRSAAERHWVLAVCVACGLTVPVLRALVPSILAVPVPVGPLTPLVEGTRNGGTTAPTPAPGASAGGVETDVRFVAMRPPAAPPTGHAGAVVWIWLAGVVVAAGRLALGLARLRVLSARATPLEAGPWRTACDDISRAVGLAAPVQLLHSRHPSLLATWGWRRPVVLLPLDAPAWPPDRIRVVLAHELAHVGRHDWLHQLAAEGLRALHWFNPLTWLMCRRLKLESEHASDDAVLALGIDGAVYAAHLVALARRLRRPRPSWIPAPSMVRPSSLERRVRAMLDPTTPRRPLALRIRLLMTVSALGLTLPLAAASAGAQYHALRGTLLDPTGRALPDAVVALTNPATAARHEVRSDGSGHFEMVGLLPATYALEIHLIGFRSHTEQIAIAGDVERSIGLEVGTLRETVTVVGDGTPAPVVDEAALARRDAIRQRAAERQQRALATCAAGPPAAVGGNILPPMKITHVSPAYPEHLRPAGVRGAVTMRATIDRDGTVSDLHDVVASHPDLQAPAVDAVRQWRFTTTLLNCDPIAVEMTVTVNFAAAP